MCVCVCVFALYMYESACDCMCKSLRKYGYVNTVYANQWLPTATCMRAQTYKGGNYKLVQILIWSVIGENTGQEFKKEIEQIDIAQMTAAS